MRLCFPKKILDQHLVMLGKTGAGKSSGLRHIVEHLLREKKRVCIIDPKGDWWGLKSAGTAEGFPVIAFGDFKEPKAQDVPINAQSGKHVAELVTSGNRPCIIGFRGWPTAQMVRFWIDFAEALFSGNAGELYVVGDEFHNFAPKGKIMNPQAGLCLHWSNRLLSEGRGLGLVFLIASQRPQKVHNDTLTCCETLVAMRVVHKADRDAVKDWIEGCGDMDQGKKVLGELASMNRGEAYVWSPEAGFGPERLTFPMFETFDSFAPPQLQKKISNAGWVDVDLDAVKEKLATVIEEQKANDPSELKRTVSDLRRQLAAQEKKQPAPVQTKTKEVPALSFAERNGLDSAIVRLELGVKGAREEMNKFDYRLDRVSAELKTFRELLAGRLAVAAKVVTLPPPPGHKRPLHVHIPRPTGAPTENGALSRAARAILTAAIQRHPKRSSRAQLSILSGYSITSSSFANALGELRTAGLMDGLGDDNGPTAAGVATLPDVPPLPTGPALLAEWCRRLEKSERTLLEVIALHSHGIERADLSAQSGYSEASSSFANAVGKLRTLELVTRGWPVKPSEELFA